MKIIGKLAIMERAELCREGARMAESSAILKETISSVINRSELPRYLADFATEKGYPIGRVRWSENQQRFFGYGQGGIFLAIERAVLRCVGVIIEFRGAVEVLSSILGLFVK